MKNRFTSTTFSMPSLLGQRVLPPLMLKVMVMQTFRPFEWAHRMIFRVLSKYQSAFPESASSPKRAPFSVTEGG